MLLRFLMLAVILLAAHGIVSVIDRWKIGRSGRVFPGLTLVAAPGCRDCVEAKSRFDAMGASYRVIGTDDPSARSVGSYTVPYAFVGSVDGELVMVRRGRSVVNDAQLLAEASDHVMGTVSPSD
jgi:glutaredoxin